MILGTSRRIDQLRPVPVMSGFYSLSDYGLYKEQRAYQKALAREQRGRQTLMQAVIGAVRDAYYHENPAKALAQSLRSLRRA